MLIKEEYNTIVEWLCEEYLYEEVIDMLDNSTIKRERGYIRIEYDNGMSDIVKINLMDKSITHINPYDY